MRQIGMFDGSQPLKITKPIRLIECFAGYGSQALALKYLGVDFEHWKIAEWAVKSIQAYKDMHFPDDDTDYSAEYSKEWLIDYLFAKGISADYNKPMTREQIARMGEGKIRTVYNNIIATHNLVSVCGVSGKDLEITDTDKYDYILTYSFPCQDLSQAGLSKGMQKGSGTRSGLLWEIERILDECEELPQILLMENVPQVIGDKNRDAFRDWFCKLEILGYKSYYKIMNGKDYEIPQNRERCFIVSCLGDYYYDFPEVKPLKLRLKDMLEAQVDEKYYLSDVTIERITNWNAQQEQLKSFEEPVACEIRVDEGETCGCKHILEPLEPKVLGGIGEKKSNKGTQWYQQDRIYDNNIAISVTTSFNPYYKVEDKTKMFQYPRGENKGGIREVDACPTITTCSWENNCMLVEDEVKIAVNSATKSGYEIAEVGDSIDIAYPNSKTRRGRVGKEVAQTLMTSDQMAVLTNEPRFYDYYNKTEISGQYCGTLTTGTAHNGSGTFLVQKPKDYRIRKLTPKECFRLMGVKDEEFERVALNQSNSSLYHCAGDSIVTTCLMAIFGEMLDVDWHSKIQLLYEGMKNESTL